MVVVISAGKAHETHRRNKPMVFTELDCGRNYCELDF